MYHIGLQILRAKLRGFHAAGSSISFRISKSEKERKHRLWDTKRKLGTHCRHHLIAYGLLRGLPYEQIERCANDNKPDPKTVLDIMLAHADWRQAKELDLEKVKALLATETPVTAAPAATSKPSLKPIEHSTKPMPAHRRLLEKRV